MANLFGGEGGFGLRASGQGEVLVSVYGAVDTLDLQPGEAVTVDTGHVVAYDLAVQFRMRRAVEGRSAQSMKTGEGWVFDFIGPAASCCSPPTPTPPPSGSPPGRRPSSRARVWAACSAEPVRARWVRSVGSPELCGSEVGLGGFQPRH